MEIHLVNLLLVLGLASIAGSLAERIGYPSLLGELVVGIVFGPSALGLIADTPDLHVLAEVGVFLLLLYIGMEVNYRDLLRCSRHALLAAAGGFLAPMAAGYLLMVDGGFSKTSGLVVGLCLGVTSLAVLSRILVDLKLLGTRIATVMIACAVLSDTAALIGFGMLLSLKAAGEVEALRIVISLGKAVLFFGISGYIGLRLLPPLGNLLTRFGINQKKVNFTLVIVIGLVFAELAELAGLHSILGAFIGGMFMRGEVLKRRLSHEVTEMVHDISIGFLAPLFFVMAGFHVDLSQLVKNWELVLLVMAVSMAAKTAGTALLYLPSKRGWPEACTLGMGMNGHGAVEVIIAEIALKQGFIGKDIFTVIVFASFLTTALVPGMLKIGTGWLRRKNQLVRSNENRSGIIIAGASPLARLLATYLEKEEPVYLIDRNRNHYLTARSMGLKAMEGNALNEEALAVFDASTARAFISMTINPQVNILALENASEIFAIPDLYAIPTSPVGVIGEEDELPENAHYLFGPGFLLQEWDTAISKNNTVEAEFSIAEEMSEEELFHELQEQGILPLVLERDGVLQLPAALDLFNKGDVIKGIRRKASTLSDDDPFNNIVKKCPIMDLPGKMEIEKFFEEMSAILSGRLNEDPKKLFNMFKRREMESTTVLVPGLAVPHIMLKGIDHTEMVVVRCVEGITFFEDDAEAKLVFVLVGPTDDRNTHLRIISAIAQLFQVQGLEDSLLSVKDTEGIREVLLHTERRRF